MYSGRTKYAERVSELCKLSEENLCPQKLEDAESCGSLKSKDLVLENDGMTMQ